MYLLDTNACIRFLRDARSSVAQRLAQVPYHEVVLCSITQFGDYVLKEGTSLLSAEVRGKHWLSGREKDWTPVQYKTPRLAVAPGSFSCVCAQASWQRCKNG